MEPIRQYVISVIAITFLCGLVQLLFRESTHKGAVKLLTGLMITITVIKPALNIRDLKVERFLDGISIENGFVVRQGEETAEIATAGYIKEALESYISSKAESMGADITAEVMLGDNVLEEPKEVVITGNISPYMKGRLVEMITNDLGIERDKQIWISRN